MSSPHRVQFVKQLDGSRYAGLNCTCACAAMAADRNTIGQRRYTAATIRGLTGDTSGGTTLRQVDAALAKVGLNLDVRTPMPVSTFDASLRDGRGAILQGSSRATKGSRYQASETFAGNHAWWVNEGRGWRIVNGFWTPTDYLVFDPLGDGRRPAIVKSPFWLPRSYLLTFARLLDVDGNGNLLGPGRVFAALSKDTEPHFHPHYGGRATSPFPDRTRATAPKGKTVNVRTSPNHHLDNVIAQLEDDEVFTAYQKTTEGSEFNGSRVWYGDHQGSRWVHEARLTHEGGST